MKGTVTRLEMSSSPASGMSAGAVPLTTYAVSIDGPEPKPAFPICQVFHVWVNPPLTVPTPLIWNRPARFVFGPWNGVPGVVGVVDRSTTSPGAPPLGPGTNVGAVGLLKNGL